MTRINSGIDPKDLCDKHLLAEHREIKRIPNCIAKGISKISNIPPQFTLGTGHVKFFYDKLGYLKDRYIRIRTECHRRNFNIQNYETCWDNVPKELMNNWQETDEARELIQNRIAERLKGTR